MQDKGPGAGVGNGLGAEAKEGVATGVGAGDADGDAAGVMGVEEGAVAEVVAGLAVGTVVVVGVGLGLAAGGDDPAGVGTGVFAHAARTTPRRRDAARRFVFICRRRWCFGLSRR